VETATPVEIDMHAANQRLAPLSAEERIQWAVEQFGMGLTMLSSMQKTASILMHIFYRLGLENEIIFGDTGYHFHETLQLRDQYMRDFKLNIVTVYPTMTPEQQEKHYGQKLYQFVDGQKECCRIRKEDPFLLHMRSNGRRCVVSGLRSSEGGKRGGIEPLHRDPRIKGYTLHPIYDWSDEAVAEYIRKHDLTIHPLHAQSYPSIGCECCTTPVAPGEDERAGRWRHLRTEDGQGPTYCGINFTDGSGI
jgi:phosphoadenosine phosphosulfate reductase